MRSLWLLTLAVLIGGSFSGCTTAQRKEMLNEVKEWGIEEFTKLKPQVLAMVDAKLAEQETKQLAELDKKLAEVAAIDAATGVKIVLTWQNFDADKNGHLDLMELGKASLYMTTRAAEKVGSGEWTSADAKKYGTGGGIVIALLAGLALVNRMKGSGNAPAAPGATPATKT